MLSNETINKLYHRVDNIIANLSYKDWYNTNYTSNGKKKYKKNHGYSLSFETLEALDVIKLIHNNMSRENEEIVKGFIMRYWRLKPEYLEDLRNNN